jgi:hypothetical protein
MTIVNGYVTLEELQGHLSGQGFPTEPSPENLTNMEIAINAVSRLIDDYAGTRYYAATETKTFRARFWDLLEIPDLVALDSLKTDENADGVFEYTWDAGDYWLEPVNAQNSVDPAQKRPYRQIRVNPDGNYAFPVNGRYSVEITGDWGYSTTPPAMVKQICLLMANRIFRRKDAIFGVAGSPQLGVQVVQARIKQDSDIVLMLEMLDRRGL